MNAFIHQSRALRSNLLVQTPPPSTAAFGDKFPTHTHRRGAPHSNPSSGLRPGPEPVMAFTHPDPSSQRLWCIHGAIECRSSGMHKEVYFFTSATEKRGVHRHHLTGTVQSWKSQCKDPNSDFTPNRLTSLWIISVSRPNIDSDFMTVGWGLTILYIHIRSHMCIFGLNIPWGLKSTKPAVSTQHCCVHTGSTCWKSVAALGMLLVGQQPALQSRLQTSCGSTIWINSRKWT